MAAGYVRSGPLTSEGNCLFCGRRPVEDLRGTAEEIRKRARVEDRCRPGACRDGWMQVLPSNEITKDDLWAPTRQ